MCIDAFIFSFFLLLFLFVYRYTVIGRNLHIPIVYEINDFTKLESKRYFVDIAKFIHIVVRNKIYPILFL